MSNSIIAAIPVSSKRIVIWFDNGVSKRYTSEDLGLDSNEPLPEISLSDDGSSIEWGQDGTLSADELLSRGEDANYVEEEKRRLLKSLSEIRRGASFSQTRLGDAAGIRQSVISRIEGCEISPQINTLLKLLAPLGKTLAIVDLEDEE